MVCNSVGVWAVDDRGCIHFRHGHVSNSGEYSLLNPAWISIPGEPKYYRLFAQIFCGPEDWMVKIYLFLLPQFLSRFLFYVGLCYG
jgi:hypothetical protein